MAHDGRMVRLGDLVSFKHGWPFKSEFFSEDLTGRPIVVAVGNFRYSGGFRFDETTVKEYRGDYPPEYELKPGDILVVMTCQTPGGEILGVPARVPCDGRIYLHNQRLGKVVIHEPEALDDSYLYWLFLGRAFNRELCASATGTKILHTAPVRMEAFRFRLPPFAEQRAIAGILDALDAKIELNRQMNGTVDAIARALFKSWFIDFDPVRAKMAGHAPVSMDTATAALFPDRLESSVIGPIPEGWHISALGDHVSLQRGTTYQSRLLGLAGPYLLGLASIQRNGGFRRDKLLTYGGESPEKLLLVPGNLYVSLKDVTQAADLLGAVAMVPPDVRVGRLTQDTVKLELTTQDLSRGYLYGVLTQPLYRAYCRARAIGTTNLSLSREDFLDYPVLVPSREVLSIFSSDEIVLRSRLDANNAESRTLTSLRDLLLPKLLSGELRVRDAEREVEKVA